MRAIQYQDCHADVAAVGLQMRPPPESLPGLRAELETVDWDVRLLARCLPALVRLARELPPKQRLGWMLGLRQVWRRQGWALPDDARLHLLELAAIWCDWPLARSVGESLRETQDAGAALSLLEALYRLGENAAAGDLALRWQLAAPGDDRFAQFWRTLTEWGAWRGTLPDFEAEDLRLEPLGHQHLRDYAWQYHDPSIAELCRLPVFRNNRHWHDWLDELYREDDELPLAVLHREWGFVGCAHLVKHGDVGFFHYWLGPDFRGQGLATRAGRLLLDTVAQRLGLRVCYAKVFEHNTASRRVLERLGFANLEIRAAPPDATELFYRLGEAATRAEVVRELHEVMAGMHSEIRVAAPVSTLRACEKLPQTQKTVIPAQAGIQFVGLTAF